MLEALRIFRLRIAGHPLLLAIAVLAVLLILRRAVFRHTSDEVWAAIARRLLTGLAMVGLLAYVVVAFWYASDPHFVDNAEPTVVAIGWLFHIGLPIYHAGSSPERYALIYGPIAFMAHGFVLAAFGASITVSKLLGAVAGVASVGVTYFCLRGGTSISKRALVLAGVYAVMLLLFRQYSFWTRPEPLELLAVSVALICAVRGRSHLSAGLTGLASGILAGLKFTGPLYVLPIFVLVFRRTGWTGVLLALAAGLVVAAAPFLLFSNVSLTNYFVWVRLSAGTGLVPVTIRQNVEWSAFFAIPTLLSYYAVPDRPRAQESEWRDAQLALLLGMSGVAIAAAKPGAGAYHLLPFLPILIYLVALHGERLSPGAALRSSVSLGSIAFCAVAALIAFAQQAQLIETMAARRSLHEIEDLQRFASGHHGVVEMGYGATEALTLERPVLVFRNNSYLLDEPAVQEHQLAGVDLPTSTIEAIARCRVSYWLIPKGELPFSTRNAYPAVGDRLLFPELFRREFYAAYERVSTTDYYDVWQCGVTRRFR